MSAPRFLFRPHVVPLASALEPARAACCLARRRGLAWLDSAGGAPHRTSVLAFDPLEVLGPRHAVSSMRALRAFARQLEPASAACAVPGSFQGGFIGALAYDLGIEGEGLALPRDSWRQPLVVGGLYCDFLVFDHVTGGAWLVLGERPGDGRADWREREGEVLRALAQDAPPEGSPAGRGQPAGELVRHTSAAEHRARIEALRRSIGRGELYQANLAHRFSARVAEAPLELYLRLRRWNAAPYAAFLDWTFGEQRGAILSASPELLLELDGRHARTRPIKGTRARGRSLHEDRALMRDLLASEKELAELTMIVDLERNDLGRVAQIGTVRVGEFPALESYAAVHHLVADVECDLRAEVDAFDVLAALFPGGSITGAPKIASMHSIAELEREGRGFFTGSLGFVDTRGDAQWNILIRTIVWRPRGAAGGVGEAAPGEIGFHVGGGITWASDPQAEERETLDKGSALAAALFAGSEIAGDFGPLAPLWSSAERVTEQERR